MRTRELFRDHAVPILALLIANLVVFHAYWTADLLFSGKDLLTAFGPLLNFQTDCLQERSLPLWNPFLNFGYPFVEHYSNTLFFPTHLLMGLFTGSNLELIQREILLWVFLAGVGVYLCARELGRSRTAAVVAGISYMLCGQMLALPHWHLSVYNAACFPYLLLGYFRAKHRGTALSIVAVLFLAFSLYGGHMTTSVLGVYMFSGFVLVDSLMERRFLSGLRFLALTGLLAGLLALPKLAPMLEAMRSGPRMLSPESLHTKDPYNVVNLYNFMGLLLPVKFYFSIYLGQLTVLATLFALFRRKLRINGLLVACVLASWFLMVDNEGNVSLLRSAANVLPVMKLVRNEWLMWFYPSLFAVLFSSEAVDAFLAERPGRAHRAAAVVFTALLVACYLLAYDTRIFAIPFVEHLVLTAALLVLPALHEHRRTQFAAACGIVALDFFLVFSFVAPDLPPERDGTRIRIAVIDQGSIAKSFRADNTPQINFYAVALQDRLRPPVSAAVNWPVLRSGLHGAPVINYSADQYGMFIDDMNLKRFSGWWYNGQERYDFIRLKDSPLLAKMEGMPLFVFVDQAGGWKQPLLSFDGLTCSSFSVRTRMAEPGRLILHQMYDDRWLVAVDGRIGKPVRENGYFMAVDLTPGDHQISFRFRDRLYLGALATSGATLAGLAGWALTRRRFRSANRN